jgi:hypothetical protein
VISDLELVQAAADTYTQPPTLPVPMTGVCARVAPGSDGTLIVAFRGSVTVEDWVHDFIFAPTVDREHPQLGVCHAGFLDDAESIVDEVARAVGDQPWLVTGHSLGGAIALGTAGLMACRGRAPQAFVTFGAPRFGMDKFVNWLLRVPGRQYRRGNDPVPTVPEFFPPLFRFLDARDPLIGIGAPQRDRFACHHIAGYVADVEAYLKTQAAA